MSRKSQIEILGVAFIVIIIVVGAMFMIGMRLNKKAPESNTLTDPELAQSFLNAIMNTKTEKNIIVSQIIKACYEGRHDFCGSTTTSDCCEYAHKTLVNALEATLGEWKRSYRLTVVRGSDKRITDIPENGPCNDDSAQMQPGVYYIVPPPQIVVTLNICLE